MSRRLLKLVLKAADLIWWIFLEWRMKTLQRRQLTRVGLYSVNFEPIQYVDMVLLVLTLNIKLLIPGFPCFIVF